MSQLDPAPFREWCEEHLADGPEVLAARLRLSPRRLYAWRFELAGLDRADLEDALNRAGYELWEVYPDLVDVALDPEPEEARRSAQAKLTDRKLRALHLLHTRGGFSIRELGRRVWEREGFLSARGAEISIRRGFARLYLPIERRHPTAIASLERCRKLKADGQRCIAFPLQGEELCVVHHPDYRDEVAERCRALRNQVAA